MRIECTCYIHVDWGIAFPRMPCRDALSKGRFSSTMSSRQQQKKTGEKKRRNGQHSFGLFRLDQCIVHSPTTRMSTQPNRSGVLLVSVQQQVLKESAVTKGAVNYRYLTLKYNTVTRSGYDVERIAYVAATVRRKKLITLAATVSSERRKKMDVDLDAIRASFRVGDVGASDILPGFD